MHEDEDSVVDVEDADGEVGEDEVGEDEVGEDEVGEDVDDGSSLVGGLSQLPTVTNRKRMQGKLKLGI